MRSSVFGVFVLTIVVPAFTSAADSKKAEVDRAVVGAALARPINDRDTTLKESQAFCAAKVPAMPKPKDATAWQKMADRMRADVLDHVVFRGAAAWRDAPLRVEWFDTIPGGPGYTIRKLRYEAAPGMWIPALLYMPDKITGRVPVMLNVNGHDAKGKAADYKQMRCINQAKRGIIALNVEWLRMGQLKGTGFQHSRMNQLDVCGVSGLAPFYLAMSRGLDVLLSLKEADPKRVGMAGLSGGGWQTIILSALDTRITLSNPVAGYSGFKTRAYNLTDLGDSEQTPTDLALYADYTHLTAMRAPRATLLTYNQKDDCCFAAPHALPPLQEAAAPIFRLFNRAKQLTTHINHDPGTHNFERDNREALYRAIGAEFFPTIGDKFNATEIPSEDEIKTAKELEVPLPETNADFHTLAVAAAAELPREPSLPAGDRAGAVAWQATTRADLAEVSRLAKYTIQAESVGTDEQSGMKIEYWNLQVGDRAEGAANAPLWSVPAVEIAPENARGTAIIVADAGRAQSGAATARWLSKGYRVVAIDPFYFGESKISEKDYLFALLVSAVGSRPIGIQSAQLAAVASWSSARRDGEPVVISATGPRASVVALVAAASAERGVDEVELSGAWGSLKELIRRDFTYETAPELFCFGLLARCDVARIVALIAPRKVTFLNANDEARSDLAELKSWYERWNVDHDPAPR